MSKEQKKKNAKKDKQVNPEVAEETIDEVPEGQDDGKIAALEAEIEALKAEKAEYYDGMLRARADFENFKKRNSTAIAAAYEEATHGVAEKFLPVIDNLERALETMEDGSPYKEGVQMVERQVLDVFEKLGITEIDAEGKAFDPNLHNAVMQVAAENGEEPGTVKAVLQKGYQCNDKVLRHSMVTVVE